VTFPDPNPSYQTITLNPGTYPSLTIGGSATATLNPGTYYVQGNITFNGAAKINGSGVTIVSSGSLTNTASAATALTAPLVNSSTGVPGILFASKSTSTSSFSGAATLPFAGLIYYPDGTIQFQGSANTGSSGCSEVIAGVISVTGASNLSANCSNYLPYGFHSLPNSMSISLVQ
jgi:hypothetical protein